MEYNTDRNLFRFGFGFGEVRRVEEWRSENGIRVKKLGESKIESEC